MAGHSRRIVLSAVAVPQVRRFVSGGIALAEGRESSWVTVTRTGSFTDPRYGRFEITRALLEQMVTNFESGTYGQKVFIDVAHKPADGAAGEVLRLAVEGDRLRALVQWTEFGREAIAKRGFAYLSAEYHEDWKDNETGVPHGCVLLGAGLVTRPCIKRLDPVVLSEAGDGAAVAVHPKLLAELVEEIRMKWAELLKKLREQLGAKKLGEAQIDVIVAAATKALEAVTDEEQAVKLLGAFESIDLPPGQAAPVNVSVNGLTADDVRKLLAEDAEKARTLTATVEAKRKLFGEHLATVGKGLDEAVRVLLAEAVSPLIGADTPDEVVKVLAEKQAAIGGQAQAARELSAMGYQVRGNAHISVDSSNQVKALQEAIDKRVGLAGQPDGRRFAATGGQLQTANRELAEAVLAAWDNDPANARRLHAEHRQLSGGDGVMSDVAIPAIFERTVIREALYNLVGLQFVNSGSSVFSQSIAIPYSYRDTTAAGRTNTRTYEGQGVQRAGVRQTSDTAYPLPQKLAFEVSDELRYLAGNGQLDFDIVAENVRNAVRIIGEDTEQLIFDEMVVASDEYAVTTVTNEAVATTNGTNRIFPLANFPVVKPRKIYDLQGNQIGTTQNPITVTEGGTARTEWAPGVAAGTYWVMDYNLGEIRFVNETGATITLATSRAIVATYGYTTNVFKFSTDLGGGTVKDKWDDFLYRYGLRKTLLEDQRNYRCDFGLMSGTVMTAVEQAGSFVANFKRNGADLTSEGNLGAVKGVANFKSYAPGLLMGDQRVVLGERGVTRYRMMKPWQMGQLENQKDANGRFTGKKEAYGDQFVALHTPTPLKAALTSIVLYSASGRVARVG